MKSTKRAAARIIHFFKNPKFVLLLLIAIAVILIGGQRIPGEPSPITCSTPIGGQQTPTDPNPLGIPMQAVPTCDIGGNNAPPDPPRMPDVRRLITWGDKRSKTETITEKPNGEMYSLNTLKR